MLFPWLGVGPVTIVVMGWGDTEFTRVKMAQGMKGILEQNTVFGECKRKRERKENPNFKSEPSIYSVF